MAVSTSTNKITYVSTGGTVFAYDFKILDETHLDVYLDGVLSSPSTYAVSGVGNAGGGNVTFTSAVTAGVEVLIVRTVPVTQLTVIPGGTAPFPSEAVEDGLDKLTMIVQQLEEVSDRAITWPLTVSTSVSNQLPDPSDADNQGAALVIAADGLSIETHPITGGGDIDVLTTSGDMVYFTGGSAARLPRGGGFYEMVIDPGTLLPSWQPPTTIKVADYFTPDGINDDWLNLQSVIADNIVTGYRVIELETNKTYNISQSLIFSGSNWILNGNGAMIQALSGGFTGTAAANTSALVRNSSHGYNNIPSVITSFINKNLTIRDCRFSYNGEAAAGQGNICIWFRYVDGYLVENCTFDDCGDATGMLACRNGLTNHCTATGFINAAFDHWDGCIDCGVTNCRVESTLTDTAQGIQFTGTGSLFENRTTEGCYAVNNRVYGVRHSTSHAASAIIFNAVDAGSAVKNCLSMGNYIEDADLGVVFSGDGENNQSVNDTLVNVTYAPLFMQHADGNSPDHCRFIDPTLIDCDVTTGSALATLSGISPQLRGMKVINTGSPVYNYLAWCASTASNAEVDLSSVRTTENGDTGTGRLLDNTSPKTTYLTDITQAWTPVLTFATPGDLAVVYSAQVGEYKVVNGMVKAHFKIQTSTFTHTTASGGLYVTGLPFAAATLTNSPWSNCVIFSGLTLTGMGSVAAGLTTGSQIMVFSGSGTGIANTALTTVHAPTGGDILLQGFIEYMMAPIA